MPRQRPRHTARHAVAARHDEAQVPTPLGPAYRNDIKAAERQRPFGSQGCQNSNDAAPTSMSGPTTPPVPAAPRPGRRAVAAMRLERRYRPTGSCPPLRRGQKDRGGPAAAAAVPAAVTRPASARWIGRRTRGPRRTAARRARGARLPPPMPGAWVGFFRRTAPRRTATQPPAPFKA